MTVTTFSPVIHAGFVNYDNETTFTQTRRSIGGLTVSGITCAFTSSHDGPHHRAIFLQSGRA